MKQSQPERAVRISADGRCFLDQRGDPLFWLGDTQWELFRGCTLEEAKFTLENRQRIGFTFVQVMMLGVGESGQCDGREPNAYGEVPWHNDDPTTPNAAYFANVDRIFDLAADNELALVVGIYHARSGERNPVQQANARQWAAWVSKRYRDRGNLIWSIYPRAEEGSVPMVRELVAGLREGDGGGHLITVHPDPSPASSSSQFHDEEWLGFNTIQTWRSVELIYPMVTADYGLSPTKPVVMAEGAYESGTEYGFDVTPLWVRRQAYYSYLAGASHSYGHNDSWRVLPTWKQALDAPGASQLRILKEIFVARDEWWELVPDQALFAEGGRIEGTVLNLAARHRDGRWAMVYLADPASVAVRLDKLATSVDALWIDPRTGESQAARRFANTGVASFITPDGWEDALLVLSALAERQENSKNSCAILNQ